MCNSTTYFGLRLITVFVHSHTRGGDDLHGVPLSHCFPLRGSFTSESVGGICGGGGVSSSRCKRYSSDKNKKRPPRPERNRKWITDTGGGGPDSVCACECVESGGSGRSRCSHGNSDYYK